MCYPCIKYLLLSNTKGTFPYKFVFRVHQHQHQANIKVLKAFDYVPALIQSTTSSARHCTTITAAAPMHHCFWESRWNKSPKSSGIWTQISGTHHPPLNHLHHHNCCSQLKSRNLALGGILSKSETLTMFRRTLVIRKVFRGSFWWRRIFLKADRTNEDKSVL